MKAAIQCPTFDEFIANSGQGFKGGTRSSAIDFAHPMDASIIKALDNKIINELFTKYVDTVVDASNGLMLSTSIRVDEKTNLTLYKVLSECAKTLNIPIPYTVISSSVRGLNAQTAGTDSFAYIAVSSLLTMLLDEDELKFVLGHECGHIALGHVVYHTAVNTIGQFGSLVPIVGNALAKTIQYPLNAWSRRSEISADRAGLICCGDYTVAQKALLKLEAGFMNIDGLNIDAYLKNSKRFRDKTTLGKLTEILASHPIIPKRMEALELFARSEKYYKITQKEKPAGVILLSDKELEAKTNQIIKVII